MSNIMMNPILPGMTSGASQEVKSQVEPGNERSFTDYMDKKMRAERSERKNLLGVEKERPIAPEKGEVDENANTEDPASVAALLQQLMADLKKLVKEPDTDNGEWRFQLQNLGLLDELAQQAGMSMTDLSLLRRQMEEQGSLALADLFAALQKHFQAQGAEQSVTVPETDLPLLETFLARMGVSPEELTELSGQGVSGLGELDLLAYLQGLNELAGQESLHSTVLSDWELEQLQTMLQEAGIPKSQMEELFPERLAMWQRALAGLNFDKGDAQVELNLARLKEMMEQAIAAADASRNKAELPGFLSELHNLLSQTGKESKDVGWSPVIQESLTAIYQELQKMIDLAKVKVEKSTHMAAIDEDLARQWLASGNKKTLETTAGKEGAVSVIDAFSGSDGKVLEQDFEIMRYAMEKVDEGRVGNDFANIAASPGDENAAEQIVKVGNDRMHSQRIRLSPEIQQFAADQISQGVLRGLRNSEHHLTLTLYPKELGEVKVDLHVRDSQLSLTFVMENSKVKEALESNMQEFQDSLERRGFSLEECSVSVGQDDSDEGRRLFEMAWEKMIEMQLAEENTEPDDQLSQLSGARAEILKQGSISVFV